MFFKYFKEKKYCNFTNLQFAMYLISSVFLYLTLLYSESYFYIFNSFLFIILLKKEIVLISFY